MTLCSDCTHKTVCKYKNTDTKKCEHYIYNKATTVNKALNNSQKIFHQTQQVNLMLSSCYGCKHKLGKCKNKNTYFCIGYSEIPNICLTSCKMEDDNEFCKTCMDQLSRNRESLEILKSREK